MKASNLTFTYLFDCPKADDNLKLPRSPVPEPGGTLQRGELGKITLLSYTR
jgi:hypothetical protein